MNFIVTGKDGYIASNFIKKVQLKHNIKYTSRDQDSPDSIYLDLINPERFDFGAISEDQLIVHLACISSPDVCGKNYELAYKINVTGTKYFLEKCLNKGAKVLFFSSDTVYGDSGELFDENSPCNPIGNYGVMKNEVEKYFSNEHNFKSFRLSYVFSYQDKFMKYLRNCTKDNEEADIFHPFYRNVVYLQDVVDSIVAVSEKWDNFDNNIFNICGRDSLSRKDIAEIYQKYVDKKLKIKITEPDEKFFKDRPRNIEMKSLYLDDLLGREPNTIENVMKTDF